MLSGNINYTTIIIITTTDTAITIRFKTKDSGGWARIFDFGNGEYSNNIIFTINRNNEKKIGYQTYSPDLITLKEGFINLDVNDDVWRHLAWTISTDGTWKFYINGALYQTDVSKSVPNNVYRKDAWIGKSAWRDPPYNGFIDDFRIYKTALDATDVMNLYQDDGIRLGNSDNIIN